MDNIHLAHRIDFYEVGDIAGNIRMKHAQDLLISTDLPIKDIAMAVGYSDMRGFYKMFTKYFGMTCSEMRENSKTENEPYTP